MLTLLALAVALLPLGKDARATEEDAFYTEHAGQCAWDGGLYLLNGESGYVTVYTAPEEQASDALFNEQRMQINWLWHADGGQSWGSVCYESPNRGEARSAEEGKRGWVNMSELTPLMDKSRFVAAHFSEFVMKELTLDLREFDTATLWPYPGSGGQGASCFWYTRNESDKLLTFPAYWEDSLGRRWGGYKFYEADGFICLDDPGLTENLLPEAPQTVMVPAIAADALPHPTVRIAPKSEGWPLWLWSVAAVPVILTPLLILRGRKQEKKR